MNLVRTPPRILMTADTVGGVWTFAVELAGALRNHGCEIVLATMGPGMTRSQRDAVSDLPNVTVVESRYQLEWMPNPWSDVDRAGDWLLSLAEQHRPDMLHLNGFAHAALDWPAPIVITAHSCVWSWWRAVKRQDPPSSYNEYRRRVQAGLAAANLVTAPTRAMLRELHHIYGFLGNSAVIPNTRNAHQFHSGRKQELILTAGRVWDEGKNIALLAKVAPHLAWPVEIAGSCDHPDGMSPSLTGARYLGHLDSKQLAQRFSEAAIFALPARYEPFGLSALEAGLSGCALLLGDIPSLREVWGNTAMFVDPDDDQQLIRTLNQLANDSWHRAGLARRARVRALEIANRDMGGRYFVAYQQCLHGRPQEVAA
jgi:glycogen synthase